MVADVVPRCEVAFADGASSDARDYRVDFSKIEQHLPGFVASWTLREGIEQLYDGYVRAVLSEADWSGSRYFRLRTVERLKASGLLDNDLRWRTRGGGAGLLSRRTRVPGSPRS